METVRQKSAELLKVLTKEDFQHCFDQWKKRTERKGTLPVGRVARLPLEERVARKKRGSWQREDKILTRTELGKS
ncbi:hypothetical protein TNCV_4612171 [Trichonephila clavipes]|nr:hypothetical protein TNCV_4612171 [Trichonephila clavipes]